MVFINLESLINEVQEDPFASLAANILLGLNIAFPKERVEADLSGKVMLSIWEDDKASYLKCAEVITKRVLSDDNDEWVYNEYLALFTLKASTRWPEGREAAERIIRYRRERSSDDTRAEQLNKVFTKVGGASIISRAVQSSEPGDMQDVNYSSTYEEITSWLERGSRLQSIDRILIATSQKHLLDSVQLVAPSERKATSSVIKKLFDESKRHALIEFVLLCIASILATIIFIVAYFTGSSAIKTFLGDLMAIASFGPIALLLALIGFRKKFISARSRSIFTRQAGHPPESFTTTLNI